MKNMLAALFCLLSVLALGGWSSAQELASSGGTNVTGVVSASTKNDVWIAVRTDGKAGSGSRSDSFDGATAAKFDALMNGFGANTNIHLAPSTFKTNGAAAYRIKAGCKIYGAGMGRTTVQLVDFNDHNHKHEVFAASGDCDDIEIHDLTVDGNYSILSKMAGWTVGDAVCGIAIFGNNTLIENVESIHMYGDNTKGLEEFSILVGGSSAGDMKSNCKIIKCITREYAITPKAGGYTFGPGMAYCNGGEILNCTDDGAYHGIGGGIGKNTLIQGNTTTTNTYVGWYSDTATLEDVTIANNRFAAGLIPLQWNNSNTGTNIKIINNTFVTANNSNPGNTAAIYLDQGGLTNVLIAGNHVEYTGKGNYQFIANGGHNTSLTIKDNSGTATKGGHVVLSYVMADIVKPGNSVGANKFEDHTQAGRHSQPAVHD